MAPSAVLLSPEMPYPMVGGGALRTASLLHYLARGYDLDLIVFRQPGAPHPVTQIPPGLVRRMLVIDLPVHRRDLVAKTWRNAGRLVRRVPPLMDRFAGFEAEIADFIADSEYEIGIVEHFWCAPYAALLQGRCRRLLLDLHNIESVLHARCAATESRPAAAAHRLFEAACREAEREWLPRFSELLVTSPDDLARVRELAPQTPASVYVNAIPSREAPIREEEDAIVFPGNMEYHPNISAVRWFRSSIWPCVRERCPQLVWRLMGRNPEAVARYTAGDPRIQITGAIPDAVAELARAKVVVVPLLAGSGTRFKILEAWAAAAPVVSTPLGAEGLPVRDGEHLILAGNAENFADAIIRLSISPDARRHLGNAGRVLLEQQFTWDAAWKTLNF